MCVYIYYIFACVYICIYMQYMCVYIYIYATSCTLTRIKPVPSAVEVRSLNYWTAKEALGILYFIWHPSVQFSSVTQSCLTLCNPMNCSAPGFPVHHQLPEFTQTHVHQVRDAIQPSHPLSTPSPPAPNPSQHHSLFQ